MTHYRRRDSLGYGGFGEVFVCERETDGETFAMKVLADDQGGDAAARFRREVRLLSSLDHPNVVKVVATRLDVEPLSYVMPLYNTSLQAELARIGGDEGQHREDLHVDS